MLYDKNRGLKFSIIEKSEKESETEDLVGLGGWLVWFQIRNVVGLFMLISQTVSILKVMFVSEYVLALIVLEVFLIIFCMVLFYLRYLLFRMVYLCLEVMSLIVVLIVSVSGSLAIFNSVRLVSSIIWGIVIMIALFRSRRVKNTFYKLGEKPSLVDKHNLNSKK